MVFFIDSADHCLCGAIKGIRRAGSKDFAPPSPERQARGRSKDFALPPARVLQLPAGPELAPTLASALKQVSASGLRSCAAAGVAGPIVAVALGAADGFGLGAAARGTLLVALRQELRQLAEVLGAEGPIEAGVALPVAQQGKRLDVMDVLMEWCACPVVPTYEVGVHLALGDASASAKGAASEVAWLLRLCCARQRVNLGKVAPMFGDLCEVLCAADGQEATNLLGILEESRAFTRQVTEPFGGLRESQDLPPRDRMRRLTTML